MNLCTVIITGTGGLVYGYGTNYIAEVGILDGHVA